MTTTEMLTALTYSQNLNVRTIACDILMGLDTIEHQKTICGKFLQNVFEGKYEDAFRVADNYNKHAFLRFLFDMQEDEKAGNLIKQTGFKYRR